ncbi:MAG: hypothetical protein AB4042_20750 [Leptolyngbyaceae cyanobacterium]
MDPSISIACGFLGGTILAVDGGYRVLQHPRPERLFDRIADARWFLAVRWCDSHSPPAAILTHNGQFSFQNQAVWAMGETTFIPLNQRQAIFNAARTLNAGESVIQPIHLSGTRHPHQVEVMSVEIDPRYGKVALVSQVELK